jgi:PAS domain S-box-containing protein
LSAAASAISLWQERQLAKEALQQESEKRWRSQKMLQMVMDLIPQSIWWKDRSSRFLGCNRNFARLAGVETSNELIGKTDYDIWTKEEADCFRSVDARVMTQNQAEYGILEPASQRDGTVIWLETNKIPLHDRLGRVIGTLGTAQDVTARKQAEEALRESEERFKTFMNNSPAVAFMKDEQGRFVYINEPFERFFKIKMADWLGKTDFDVWSEELALQFRENDRIVLDTNKTLEVVEVVPSPEGHIHHWLSFKFPCLDISGQRLLGGMAINITKQKLAELALQQQLQVVRQESVELILYK